MAKPKNIKDAVRVTIVLSKQQLERVEHMARLMAVQEKRRITASEAIRMAVAAAYPVPKDQQAALF